jgi:hypothetical protein
MAKITYGPIVGEARGKAGDTVFTRTRGGAVARALSLQAGGVGPHTLLSTTHTDTNPATPPTRGDLITGQDAPPLWKRLAKGAVHLVLRMGANDPEWGAVELDQAAAVSGILPKASGGTGTAAPALVAGTNIAITGTWPAHTVSFKTPLVTPITIGDGLFDARLNMDGGTDDDRVIYFRKGGLARWYFGVPPGVEGGSNAGSDFQITRYADNQANLGNALYIKRSTGNVAIGNITPAEKLQVDGNVRANLQLISSIAIGTAPLVVTSTTEVANLNAHRVGGTDLTNAAATGLIAIGSGTGTAAWTTPDGARVYNSAAQVIADVADTLITYNTERWDNGGLHSTVSNTGRLTAVKAGKYQITANVTWTANATGVREVWIDHSTAGTIADAFLTGSNVLDQSMCVTTIYHLAAGEYVTASAFQSSGGNLNLNGTPGPGPEFSMQWLGP